LVIDLEARQGDKAEDMQTIQLDYNQLLDLVIDLKINEKECYPLDTYKFTDYVWKKYHRERLNPEGALCACDSPNSDHK
jgi:hypothetical protein